MELSQLIAAGKDKVRSTPELMAAYISLFEERFGRKPACSSCTFNTDWALLTGAARSINQTFTMENTDNTFKLRDVHEIYTYFEKAKKGVRGKAVRTYGYRMSEDFAEAYLTTGTAEELKKRAAKFKTLPKKFRDEEQDLEILKKDELLAIAEAKGYDKDEFKRLNKTDLIAYLWDKMANPATPETETAPGDTDTDTDTGDTDADDTEDTNTGTAPDTTAAEPTAADEK